MSQPDAADPRKDHRVRVELTGHGRGRVWIDGADISERVSELWLTVKPGRANEVTILLKPDEVVLKAARAKVKFAQLIEQLKGQDK